MGGSQRSGSAMSTKQMAYAATAGRKITFRFLSAGVDVQGYLVGMDDYHWMVAAPNPKNEPVVETVLVHKGSADLIKIDRTSTLGAEPPAVRMAVDEIGRPFFTHCAETYSGNSK